MLGYGAFVEHEMSMYHPGVPAPGWPDRASSWTGSRRSGRSARSSTPTSARRATRCPVDGYIYVIQQLLDHGISEKDIRQMICRNTAYLLGLEETN